VRVVRVHPFKIRRHGGVDAAARIASVDMQREERRTGGVDWRLNRSSANKGFGEKREKGDGIENEYIK
jgi:hypothetical protein